MVKEKMEVMKVYLLTCLLMPQVKSEMLQVSGPN